MQGILRAFQGRNCDPNFGHVMSPDYVTRFTSDNIYYVNKEKIISLSVHVGVQNAPSPAMEINLDQAAYKNLKTA